MSRWQTASEEETRRVGEALVARLFPLGVLLLSGDLGAGKTVLAQGIARGLGLNAAEVQSPTFTIIREHRGPRGRLVHVDLYRLSSEDVPALGLEELLAGEGVKVVEWAERLPFAVPGAMRLAMRRLSGHEREIFEDESQDERLKERA